MVQEMGLFEKSFLLSKIFLFYSFTSFSRQNLRFLPLFSENHFMKTLSVSFQFSFSFLCFGFMNEESKRLAKKKDKTFLILRTLN